MVALRLCPSISFPPSYLYQRGMLNMYTSLGNGQTRVYPTEISLHTHCAYARRPENRSLEETSLVASHPQVLFSSSKSTQINQTLYFLNTKTRFAVSNIYFPKTVKAFIPAVVFAIVAQAFPVGPKATAVGAEDQIMLCSRSILPAGL